MKYIAYYQNVSLNKHIGTKNISLTNKHVENPIA